MLKYLTLFIFLCTGLLFSQPVNQRNEEIKNTLIDMTIRWNELSKNQEGIMNRTGALIFDLQNIKDPSEELIAILKKYNVYMDTSKTTNKKE